MRFSIVISILTSSYAALQNCPMAAVRSIITRATEATRDPAIQMQIIRRIMEDIYGGSWGVLIIKNPALVSTEVHWTFPEHRNVDGSLALCASIVKGLQYNVFKTSSDDLKGRMTVENVIKRLRQNDDKPRPTHMTVRQFDQLLAKAIEDDMRG